MTTSETIQEITNLVNAYSNGKITFGSPISVKKNPHSWPVIIYGVEIGIKSEVQLIDANGEKHVLTPVMDMAAMITSSLYQRIKYLISNVTGNRCTATGSNITGV
jgi:hypothetical protein